MRRLWTRALLIGAVGLAAGSSAGCAEERAAINRVQPNALAKSFFVGKDLQSPDDDEEFWFQTTLVDVGYGAAQNGLFTSTYAQPLSRIKWQITENHLIARVTYERINDSDGKGAGPKSNDGVIAAVYPIISHFDIRRDYNPTTGEESNVIVENGSDRPWNLREYFRVDWGTNLATDAYDFDTLSLLGLYGGIKYEPLTYYINDPQDPDAPHFDSGNGYFDVTNKAFAKPGLIDLSSFGWGIDSFPACYLDADFAGGTAPYGNCNPVELTLRQSFRKVVDNDFEPKDWDGWRFQAYGAFYEDRYGYDRNYGMVDKKRYRMIDRYNIWERSHYYQNPEEMTGEVKCYVPTDVCADGSCVGTPFGADPNRDTNGNGTSDECEAVTKLAGAPGSQCDTFSQKCTLPYTLRKEKPVVWYYTMESHPDFYESTGWAAHEWDIAMRSAVYTAKYSECVRVGHGDTVTACTAQFDPQNQPTEYAQCVRDGNDPKRAACNALYPVPRYQQDSNQDLIQLSKEVDDCRNQVPGPNGKPVYGGTKCEAVADQLGNDRGYEADVIKLAKMPEMIVFCHSPVEANDPEACAPPDKRLPAGTTAAMCNAARKKTDAESVRLVQEVCNEALTVRMGDLRYNQVNAMIAPQTPSPWGIYTDAEDPLTGEKVSASINVWTHVNDLFSQGLVDTARFIKGELPADEITEGKYVRDWAAAADAAGDGMAGRWNQDQVRERIAAVAGKEYDPQNANQVDVAVELEKPELRAKVRDAILKARTVKADMGAPSTNAPVYAARLRALAGTDIEAELFTKAMQQFAGVDGLPMSQDVLNMGSPVRGANRTFERQFERFKQNALAQRGACILSAEDAMAPAPLAIADLANVLEQKFGAFNPADSKDVQTARAKKMQKYLAERAHYAVIVHEMGHSIALRHNFVSSSDAFNYRSQYWLLRTDDNADIAKKQCSGIKTGGQDCVGPRYYDPMTPNEKNNLINMFMHSSVMDYAGELTQDLVGLGAYDFAAARMFYGDTVAVYGVRDDINTPDDESFDVLTPRGRGVLEKIDNFGGLLGFSPSIGNKGNAQAPKGTSATDIHYSALQANYNLIQNCQPVDPYKFKPASWDTARWGEWHPVVDGLIVATSDGVYKRCKQQPVDFVQWNTLRFPQKGPDNQPGSEIHNFYRGGPAVDPEGRTRVPYGFATDRWADLGNSAVYRHDNGADIYELFDFFITTQEVGHIFDNYRRGRASFSVRGAAGRRLGRYNEKLRDSAKGLGLLANIFEELGLEAGIKQQDIIDYALVNFYPQNALASGIAFDHFARMMSRPEPGEHIRLGTGANRDPVLRSRTLFFTGAASDMTENPTELLMHNGATGFYGNVGWGGELLENTLAEDQGEYDAEFTMNKGSYYEKMYVPMLMTESEDNFISDSITDFSDARYRSVSLADVFGEGYRRWLANNLTGDDEIKGVRIVAKQNDGDLVPDVAETPDQCINFGQPNQGCYLKNALGTTSWWIPAGPQVCFPNANNIVCSHYGKSSTPFDQQVFPNTLPVDPLVGWEQQKFLIAWTYVYLPENQKRYWLDRLELRELSYANTPAWQSRIELHMPDSGSYVARRYGTETIFGKVVQKGIAARVLQYANELMSKAYQGTWHDENGAVADQANPGPNAWYLADIDPSDGLPIVKFDPFMQKIAAQANCSGPNDQTGCTCDGNKACAVLDKYKSVPWFMSRMDTWIKVGAKGLYPEAL